MSARILSGSEAAKTMLAEVAARVAALEKLGHRAGLATVRVGEHGPSAVYVRAKHAAAAGAGMASFDVVLPAGTQLSELEEQISNLNADPAVDGIVVQLPLPESLDAARTLELIAPDKDADGLHPLNLGRLMLERASVAPATPTGILALLNYYQIETARQLAVIVGRSHLVGRPLALMLGSKGTDATVCSAHSRTPELAELTRRADLLIVAAGRPRLIGASHIKPGATVIDVGINRVEGRLVGDVDFDSAREVAGAISPVPGGVGPMTVASLLANTVTLAERSAGGAPSRNRSGFAQ